MMTMPRKNIMLNHWSNKNYLVVHFQDLIGCFTKQTKTYTTKCSPRFDWLLQICKYHHVDEMENRKYAVNIHLQKKPILLLELFHNPILLLVKDVKH